MWRIVSPLVVLLLVLVLLVTPVAALNDVPETAIVLTAQNPAHSDRLVGDPGGAVRFYRVDYAGAGHPVKVDLTAVPGRDTTGLAFGFKIYGPAGLIGEAPVETNGGSWTRYSMTFSTVVPGAYLVQVYNYSFGIAVDYSVQASGLDLAGASAQPEPPTPPVGSTAENPIGFSQPGISVGGSLLGQPGGAMQYFTVEYPGGGTPVTVSMRHSPPSPFQNGAVGFHLYRGATMLGKGVETQRDASSATASFTFADEVGGPILLQVHNYEPGFMANYVLTLTGAAAQAVQVTGNTSPDKAVTLTASQPSVFGSIGPGSEATFHYFLVTHPGGNREVVFRITVDAAGGIADRMVGFNLFKGADLAGQAFTSPNDRGDKWTASFTLRASEATTYGVQVFNYSTRAPAVYRLYVQGL